MNIKFLKKLIIPILIFVFLFSPFIASAISFGDVVNAVKGMWINGVNYVMGIFVYLFATFAQIAGGLLDWVTSPGFISLPYTKAGSLADGGNPIIEAGLNITKNFVNMGLVVVLVFIALAVTLRLEEYATQKTLVRLIIIALLVNFAPIICGLIVDASNIIMNYFLVGIREGISGILIDNSTAGLTGTLTRPGSVTTFSLLAKGAVMIILNLFIGLAFLLLASVFVFRYIAIWILVILSPLAFIAWILPATKRLWEMWWKQLLNWSFIGIPMAFFLYLAMSSVAGLNTYFQTQITASGLEPETTGLLNNVFPYFAVLGILFFGFFIGISASAMGSSAVVNFAKARGGQIRTSAGWVGSRIKDRGIRPQLEKLRTKEAIGRIASFAERKMPRGLKWVVPESVRVYGQMRPAVEQSAAKTKSYSSRTLADRLFSRADIEIDALADLIGMLDRNDGQDIFEGAKRILGKRILNEKIGKEEKTLGRRLTAEEREGIKVTDDDVINDREVIKILSRPLDIASKAGMLGGATLRKDPRLAAIAAKAGVGSYKGKTAKEAIGKAVGEARSQHIALWEPEVFESQYVIEAALGKLDRDRWLQISRTVKNGQSFAHKGIDKAFSTFIKGDSKYATRDPKDVWKNEFREHIIKEQGGEGYFIALSDSRMEKAGWRPGQLTTGPNVPSGSSRPISPGSAAMGKVEKEQFKKIGEKLETIGQDIKKGRSAGSAIMGEEPPVPKGRQAGGEQTGGEQRKPKGRKPGGR